MLAVNPDSQATPTPTHERFNLRVKQTVTARLCEIADPALELLLHKVCAIQTLRGAEFVLLSKQDGLKQCTKRYAEQFFPKGMHWGNSDLWFWHMFLLRHGMTLGKYCKLLLVLLLDCIGCIQSSFGL